MPKNKVTAPQLLKEPKGFKLNEAETEAEMVEMIKAGMLTAVAEPKTDPNNTNTNATPDARGTQQAEAGQG